MRQEIIALSIWLSLFKFDSVSGCDSIRFTYENATGHDTDICHVKCNYYSSTGLEDRYYPTSSGDINFQWIRNQCPNIQDAANLGLCDGISDLVWDNSTCECPTCVCQVGDKLTDTHQSTIDYLFRKECVDCTCTESGYECNNDYYEVQDPQNWDNFECATDMKPEQCDGILPDDMPTTDNPLYPGDSWWGDISNKFCFCDYDGITTCLDDYEQLAFNNTDLTNAFLQDCGYRLRGCFDEPDLWRTSRNNCPECTCGDRTDGDLWYRSFEKYGSDYNNIDWERKFDDNTDRRRLLYPPLGDTRCYRCECDPDDGTSCYEMYQYSGDSCPPSGYGDLQCFQDSIYFGVDDYIEANNRTYFNFTKFIGDPLNMADIDRWDKTNCSYGDDTQNCGWKYVNDDSFVYGCIETLFCDGLDLDESGQCVYFDITKSYEVCGETEIITPKYYSCCDGNYCNYEDADISQCEKSQELEDFYVGFFDCLYDENSAIRNYCDANAINDFSDCSEISDIGEWYYKCYCDAYSMFYPNLKEKNQLFYQNQINELLKGMDAWIDAFQCIDIQSFHCNLADGTFYTLPSPAPTTSNPTTSNPTTSNPTTVSPTTASPTPSKQGVADSVIKIDIFIVITIILFVFSWM